MLGSAGPGADTHGHRPRRAKTYRNFGAEFVRLRQERIAAYKELTADVNTGRYPAPQHGVPIDDAKFAQFVARIKTQSEG
jgi:3-methyl-2-oxobutanoate hydroxymethyltransferase